MGLSANMWSSVSGLLMHGEKMGVIGNNIANISTIGFKGQRMDFEDFIYQNGFSTSGPTQLGRGVGVGAVMSDWSNGGRESSTDPTDIMISGSGFFQIKDKFSDQVRYTRAGNFRFDAEGVLRSPSQHALQGWEIIESEGPSISIGGKAAGKVTPSAFKGSGNPEDIRFNSFVLPPRQTTYAEMTVLLNSSGGPGLNDKSVDEKNPMFSLFNVWDGTQPPATPNSSPIAKDSFMHSQTMTVYDEGGAARLITTYYDEVNPAHIKDLPPNHRAYEYMVTMDPADDMRTYGGKYDQATGTLKDDLATYGDPESLSMSKAGLTDAGGIIKPSFTTPPTLDPTVLLFQLNAAIDEINGVPVLDTTLDPDPFAKDRSVLTLAEVNVLQHPSGGWSLDPNDTNVANVLANGTGSAAHNAIIGASTEVRPTITVGGVTGFPADAADANLVKRMSDSDSAGVLMMGLMIFDSGGNLISQSAYTYEGQNTGLGDNGVPKANPNNLSSWEPAPVSSSGYPVFTANFSGHPLANAPYQSAANGNIDNKDAESYLIEFNMGLRSNKIAAPWDNTLSAASVGLEYTGMALFVESETTDNLSRTTDKSSSNNSPFQDGYSFGSLSNYYVDQSGILYGIYSNSVEKPLYQIALYDFTNPQGLRREGSNAFSSTADSGQPRVGPAGQNGLGLIDAYAIEQSNVDLSREFVQMISTQRGYQANSKSITTTDSMLETVINIVR